MTDRILRRIDPHQIVLTGAVILSLFTILVVCQHFAYFPTSGTRTALEVVVNVPIIYGLYRGSRVAALAGLSIALAFSFAGIYARGFTLGVCTHLILTTSFWLVITRAAFQLSSARSKPVSG